MKYILASIRFILLLLTTFSIYFAWWIISFIIPNKSLWRQVCFRFWALLFSRIIGMKIEVIGSPPKPPFFLVSNHLSYVDIPLIRSVVDGVFVAKSEIREWFLIGKITADMENIFINRQNRRDIPQAGEKILEKLDAGEGVIVF
ncbi:MAG: 1-acyl-sn-glycerol-3-phosphate acyltransferase, partial [Acidobacteria bacterium]